MARRLLPLLLLGLGLLGCAGVARQMTADTDDYAAYRRMRTATTVEQKLQASAEYLQEHPHGRWRREVTQWYRGADAAYVERAHDDEPRLRAYLRLLPDGPHAEDVTLRIGEFDQERGYEANRRREFDQLVKRHEAQLARAEEDRHRLVSTFVRFVRHVAHTRSWGQPTWELDPRFLADWRLRAPAARCRGQRCVKTLSLRYAIPEDREIAPRQAIFDAVVELDRGGVTRVAVIGPELFNRIGEAIQLRPVPPGDVMARANAIADVLALLEPVLEDAFPGASCTRQAVSPVVLVREDATRRLRIEAPASPLEDAIVVEPLAP